MMDQTQGTEMERLWNLLGELSSQLSHNRQQTEELHRRADELRSQAVHTQTGYTLRRFNVDVSKEEFESELERLNVSLVMENQALQQENRQLSSLLKDYESTLDAVMAKFRSYAHASQQHDLELTRHYESLLLSLPVTIPEVSHGAMDPDQAPPINPAHLQSSLSHLASLIRKALRALQGEDPEDSTSPLLDPVDGHQSLSALFEQLNDSEPSTTLYSRSRSTSTSSSISYGHSSTEGGGRGKESSEEATEEESHQARLIASHHPRTNRNPPHDPASGGYVSKHSTSERLYIPTTSTSSLVASPPRSTLSSRDSNGSDPETRGNGNDSYSRDRTRRLSSSSSTSSDSRMTESRFELELKARGLGPLDEALLREVEVEALRKENEELKKLLAISTEPDEFPPFVPPTSSSDKQTRNELGDNKDQDDKVKDEEEEEEEEESIRPVRSTTTTKRELFESGAKPETLDDDEDEEEDDIDDKDEDEEDDSAQGEEELDGLEERSQQRFQGDQDDEEQGEDQDKIHDVEEDDLELGESPRHVVHEDDVEVAEEPGEPTVKEEIETRGDHTVASDASDERTDQVVQPKDETVRGA
ncbi:uncharacterized protein JCM15063_004366 [Sporobolomyces koalae]|uniref:uncharacterized protein n=1 Tax=Sporobolomyces koalae TaxID=500713 RepID=UPI00316FE7F0